MGSQRVGHNQVTFTFHFLQCMSSLWKESFYIIVDFSNPYSLTTYFVSMGGCCSHLIGLPQIQPVGTSGPPSMWILFSIFSDLDNLYETLMPHTFMAFILGYDISY